MERNFSNSPFPQGQIQKANPGVLDLSSLHLGGENMAQVALHGATLVNSTQSGIDQVQAAKALHKRDRAQGLAALNELFRQGQPPRVALDGRYAGELVALNVAPGLTQLGEWILARWLPWKGK